MLGGMVSVWLDGLLVTKTTAINVNDPVRQDRSASFIPPFLFSLGCEPMAFLLKAGREPNH